ncbi:MAG: hypothetical protein HS132_06865 [Planctomycetia bacterium]|nr:hypothetical protein [Planctomycetia bacterium]
MDGQLVNAQTHPSGNGDAINGAVLWPIGTRYTDWGFSVNIDEVRIFSRALSAQEVLSIFNDTIGADLRR